MRIVIPGGSGHVGQMLNEQLSARGHEVVILSRSATPSHAATLQWDGKTIGPWADAIDGADVVINLAGRTVNCRYTDANRKQMMDSRVDSTRVVGEAIGQAKTPPRVWLNMSTATIYDHRFDAGNDETTGWIGAGKTEYPDSWKLSVGIAKAWEREQEIPRLPNTRKVALRTSMVMSPIAGSIFGVLSNLVKLRLGGPIAGGKQFVSWIHEADFVEAILFLIENEEFQGPVNLAAPHPLPQREFMRLLRKSWGVRFGLPASKWMAAIGAIVMQTETELILKSRRVVPGRLATAGFKFQFPQWSSAADELVSRMKRN
jgi:uncharacterized protein (TIGR01777 family)